MRVFRRVLLVIEIVEEPDDAPLLDLRRIREAEPARIGAHGLLHSEGVLAQGVRLRELVQQRQRVGARLHPFVASAICRRAARAAGSSPPTSPSPLRRRWLGPLSPARSGSGT